MYIRIWDICVVLLFEHFEKFSGNFENPVDIIFAGCYIYSDRRSTTVIATAGVATTVVTLYGRR